MGRTLRIALLGTAITCERAKLSVAARLPADPPASPRCLKPQHEKNSLLSSTDGPYRGRRKTRLLERGSARQRPGSADRGIRAGAYTPTHRRFSALRTLTMERE